MMRRCLNLSRLALIDGMFLGRKEDRDEHIAELESNHELSINMMKPFVLLLEIHGRTERQSVSRDVSPSSCLLLLLCR